MVATASTVAGYDPAYGLLSGAVLLALIVMTVRRMARAWRTPLPRLRRPAAEPDDYGLLEPVAVVPTRDDAEMLRDVLATHGIRATIAPSAPSSMVVLVFPRDLRRARDLVAMR